MIGFADAQGVAVAAIQGLDSRLEEERAVRQAREAELAAQSQRIAALEARLAAFEALLLDRK